MTSSQFSIGGASTNNKVVVILKHNGIVLNDKWHDAKDTTPNNHATSSCKTLKENN